MTEMEPKPEVGASGNERPPERRARSTLDQAPASIGERGTSPARFLIVLAIALVLVSGATNLLGVWSLPGQSEARREAQRQAVERQEQERKAVEREVARRAEDARKSAEREAAAQRKVAEAREKAAEDARRKARETASRQPATQPGPTVTIPNRPELPARPPMPPAVPTPEPGTKRFNPNEVMEQARRTIEETFGKEGGAPSMPSAPPSSSAPPAPTATPSQPKSQQDLVDEIRRKLDRLSGKRGETETAAREPPPSTTMNETARPPASPRPEVSRPDLSATACRVGRSYVAAIAACDDIIKRHPDAPEAYFVRGWALNQSRQYGRAITDLSRAIDLDATDWRAYAQRGYALHSIRAFERAIEDYSSAIDMRPSDASLYNNRGLSRMLNKDHAGARIDLDKSIALNSRYALALFNRARLNQADGAQNERAIEDVTRSLDINPRFTPALSLRADLRAALGDHAAAIQDLNQLVALETRNQSAYVRRARSRVETRAFDEAKADADRALEILPRSPEALIERGRAWEGKGDPQAAIRDYRAALEMQPGHEAARSHLTRLGEE